MAGEAVKVPFIEAAAPATPAAGRVVIYSKADGLMYSKDDAGVETLMSGGAAGSGIPATIFDAQGDLIVASAADTAARLALGASGFVLTSNGTTAAWAASSVAARAARSSRTTNQTIANATWTAVIMNVADTYDTNAIHDPAGANPERFVLNATGIWSVKLRVQFDGSATGDRYLAVYLNGTQFGHTMRVPGNASYNVLEHSDDIQITAITDYVTCHVYQDSTGNLDVTTASCAVAFLGT